jgi:hypothetical protein
LENLQFSNKFDYDNLFKILASGQIDTAFDILTGQQKIIGEWTNKQSD